MMSDNHPVNAVTPTMIDRLLWKLTGQNKPELVRHWYQQLEILKGKK